MTTESGEKMFERYARTMGIGAERILEASERSERRPDFLVHGNDRQTFFAEVKLISPNKNEAKMIQRAKTGEVVGTGGTPGDHLRGLIGKANGQLKAVAADDIPGVLVVFNPEIFISWHTDPYCVLTAMRGLDVITVSVPFNPSQAPQFGKVRSGPKKIMTHTANTSTAAIICPVEIETDVWRTNVFHNRYAARTLPLSALTGEGVYHWCISDDEREWVNA